MALPARIVAPEQTLDKRLYFDALVLHQIALRRYGDTTARNLARRGRQRDITAVNRLLEGGRRRMTALDVATRARDGADGIVDALNAELRTFAQAEGVGQASAFGAAAGVDALRPTGLHRDAMSRVLPGAGAASYTLADWLTDWRRRHVRELRLLMASPENRGLSASELLARLVGTPARNFRDGLREPQWRHLASIVQTALGAMSNDARMKAAQGVADRVAYTAVLDSRTSLICANLDGRIFPIDTAPVPPRHPRCRSTLIPIPVGDDPDAWIPPGRPLSYEDWLRGQSEAVQVDVLGKSRRALFVAGKLPLNRFHDFRSNRRVSLAELQSQHRRTFESLADDFDPATRSALGL